MDETLNELLALMTTLVERIEKLEAAKEQDDINGLLTNQITSVDNTARLSRRFPPLCVLGEHVGAAA